MTCASSVDGDQIMQDAMFQLPLAFEGHKARIVVVHPFNGPWHVRTEVDGRVLGHEQFAIKAQIERFRSRMQEWLTQVEAAERRQKPVRRF